MRLYQIESLAAANVSAEPPQHQGQLCCVHEQLIDGLYDGVYFVNTERVITYWNRGAEELTGYTAAETRGRACFENLLNHVDEEGRQLCCGECALKTTLSDGKRREVEVYVRHKQGHRIPVLTRISPIRDADNKIIGAVEVFTDISAKKRVERRAGELEVLVFEDSLTRLPNRRYTELQVQQALQEVREFSRRVGVLLVDLDHFKTVNDRYGHQVGDEVLRAVSRTLTFSMRAGDVIGRWGGEEFLAIARDVTRDDLAVLAERCRKLVSETSVRVGNHNIGISASIGSTLARISDTENTLIARADDLMYRSKLEGRNRVSAEAAD